MQLILAQQAKLKPELHRFPQAYVIIDNGLWELGKSLIAAELFAIAKDVHANEVVLPDTYKDAGETLLKAYEICENLPPKDFVLAGVVQGETAQDLIWCYRELAKIREIGAIHLPKVMESIWPTGRAGFLAFLADGKYLSSKPHHMLGIWKSPEEIRLARPYVRSIDTALPVHAALAGRVIGLGTNPSKPKRPPKYFDIPLTAFGEDQMLLLQRNVRVIDELCGSVP